MKRHFIKKPVTASSNISTEFTTEEKDLIESQCYEAYDNYGDEYSADELAQIVWEHVEWLQEELEDISGNINAESVKQYAEDYIYNNF